MEWDALQADRAQAERRVQAAEGQFRLDPNDAMLRAELEAAQNDNRGHRRGTGAF